MSDTFEIDPEFIEPRAKTVNKTVNKTINQPVNQPMDTTLVKMPMPAESMVGFYAQNKTLIIIAIAVTVVLIICLAYWYFNTPKQSIAPLKKALPPPPPDNVPPANIDQIPMSVDKPATSHAGIDRPITHEELVINADDSEIDKYMNPGEPSFDDPAVNRSGNTKTADTETAVLKQPIVDIEPDKGGLLDDLEDLEQKIVF